MCETNLLGEKFVKETIYVIVEVVPQIMTFFILEDSSEISRCTYLSFAWTVWRKYLALPRQFEESVLPCLGSLEKVSCLACFVP